LVDTLTGVDSHVEIVLLIYWLKILEEIWLKNRAIYSSRHSN